jgi:hypothetical protein
VVIINSICSSIVAIVVLFIAIITWIIHFYITITITSMSIILIFKIGGTFAGSLLSIVSI